MADEKKEREAMDGDHCLPSHIIPEIGPGYADLTDLKEYTRQILYHS
jgi:hypothetical protein